MSEISDERRDAAERLRKEAADFRRTDSKYNISRTVDLGDVPAVFQDIAHCVGFDGTVRIDELFDRVANLIDPTCGEWRDDPHPVDPAGFSEDDSGLWCEHCDIPLDPDYRYCPYCGSRVVSGDGLG